MTLRGLDDLRDWLTEHGFTVAQDVLSGRDNRCNWYAYRRSSIPARECECNERKSMQLVVKPYEVETGDRLYTSSEVHVTGEYKGQWYDLKAYSVKPEALYESLDTIELNLIQAWNGMSK